MSIEVLDHMITGQNCFVSLKEKGAVLTKLATQILSLSLDDLSVLGQTGWGIGTVTAENWWDHVLKRLAQLEWQRVVEDVHRFLMNQEDLSGFKREVIEVLRTS